MSRIALDNAGKFGSGSSNDFFTLKDDGDVAEVRFLYDQPDASDIDYFVVHEVEVDGKKRYVACNAVSEDGSSIIKDNCPLCLAEYKRIEKLFLQMYVESEDRVYTWDRGRNFVSKIQTYINRYGSLVSQAFEIERKGKKGDTNTTYELFALEKDGSTLEDFPEKQELLGTLILELTTEQMYDVVDGVFTLEEPKSPPARNGRAGAGGASGARTARAGREGVAAQRPVQSSTTNSPAARTSSRTARRAEPEPTESAPVEVEEVEPKPAQEEQKRVVRRGRGSSADKTDKF